MFHSMLEARPDEQEVFNRVCMPIALIPDDDISFRWHFGCDKNGQRLLSKRMSGLELCGFILHHMVGILAQKLLSSNPSVEAEFRRILLKIQSMKLEELDEVLPWIQVIWRHEEDDIVLLDLKQKTVISSKRSVFSAPTIVRNGLDESWCW